MANVTIEQYEDNQAIVGTDLTEIYQPTSGGTRREKKVTETEKADWYADNMVFDNGLKLKAGIVALQDPAATSVTTAGYYTFSESEDTADNIASAKFRIVTDSGTDVIEVDFEESASAKTHSNTKIEILRSKVGIIRLAKSDSINGSGSKVQIYISGATDIKVYLEANTGDNAGFQLVTPYLDNTPTLPDGVTVGTFLVAGEELRLDNAGLTATYPNVSGYKNSNDQIRCVAIWPEIPKQGTSIALTVGATTTRFIDGTGTLSNISAPTISNLTIDGNNVFFIITQVGIATSLNTGPLAFNVVGAGCKLTIT